MSKQGREGGGIRRPIIRYPITLKDIPFHGPIRFFHDLADKTRTCQQAKNDDLGCHEATICSFDIV